MVVASAPSSATRVDAASRAAVRIHVTAVGALLFLAGAITFLLDMVWVRGLAPILGSTVYALSAATTAFMGAAALGSAGMALAIPRLRGLRARPVLIFGLLQMCSGLTGAAVADILFRYQFSLAAAVSGMAVGVSPAQAMLVHTAICFALLVVPVALIGGALPLLVVYAGSADRVSRFYGLNTIGAAAGCLLAGFALIERVGALNAAYFAAAASVIICAVAVPLDRWMQVLPESEPPRPAPGAWTMSASVAIGAFSGLVLLGYEVVVLRFLTLLVGDRIFVTTLTLGLMLGSLAVGAALVPLQTRRADAWTVAGRAVAVALVSLSAAIALEGRALERVSPAAFGFVESNEGIRVLFIACLVIGPSLALGQLLPLALAEVARHPHGAVRVGYVCVVNTVAGVAGSLGVSYGLLRAIGSNGTVVLTAALLLAFVAACGWLRRAQLSRGDRMAAVAAIASAALLVVPNATRYPRLPAAGPVLLTREDAHGLFQFFELEPGVRTVYQNNVELVTPAGLKITQYTQELMAYLPALFAESLGNVLVLGEGYGITAGAMTRIAEVGRIDTVEIAPAVAQESHLFAAFNYRFYADPRVSTAIADGRQFLAAGDRRYDVVTINPTNPYQPGNASLYSEDFYVLLKRRLTPAGVVCHHLFGPDMSTLYHGIRRHFAYITAVPAYSNTVLVLASDRPLGQHQRDLYVTKYENARSLFKNIMIDSLADLDALMVEGQRIVASYDDIPAAFVNSDVHPALEFRRLPGRLDLWNSSIGIDLGK